MITGKSKRFFILYLTVLLFLPVFLLNLGGAETFNFKQTGKWTPKGDEVFGMPGPQMIDKDGHILGAFYTIGSRIITPEKIDILALYGQGPSDLQGYRGITDYNGDIAIYEITGRIKIFSKKDGKYFWKKTVWLKVSPFFQVEQNLLFYDRKWFVAGEHALEYKPDSDYTNFALLKVYDEAGKPLKSLVETKIDTKYNYFEMYHYILGGKGRLFFIVENEPNVKIISPASLQVEKSVNLEVPSFYKKMPENSYLLTKGTHGSKLIVSIENWKVSYSAILQAAVDNTNNYLVVQIRTCSDKLKKYALLFYDTGSLKLKNTVFTDDFLLGLRDGKYYFFAYGNPGLDEGVEEVIINVYEWKKQ
jgi:hypothetical protein